MLKTTHPIYLKTPVSACKHFLCPTNDQPQSPRHTQRVPTSSSSILVLVALRGGPVQRLWPTFRGADEHYSEPQGLKRHPHNQRVKSHSPLLQSPRPAKKLTWAHVGEASAGDHVVIAVRIGVKRSCDKRGGGGCKLHEQAFVLGSEQHSRSVAHASQCKRLQRKQLVPVDKQHPPLVYWFSGMHRQSYHGI